MSDRRDELFDTLSETRRLVGDVEMPAGGEFSLESILAEFGQGAAEPAPREEPTALVEEKKAEPVPEKEPEELPEELPVTQKGAEERGAEEEKEALPERRKVLQFPKIIRKAETAQESPKPEETEPDSAVAEPAREEKPPRDQHPLVQIEEVMARTVDAVLEDESDGILEEPAPLKERLGAWSAGVREKLRELLGRVVPPNKGTNRQQVEEETRWEPDMEQAGREEKRRCKRLGRQLWTAAIPLVLLLALTVVDTWWPDLLPAIWHELALLRCCVAGGLLLVLCLMAMGVWREALRGLKERRVNSCAAAALPVLVVLGECVWGACGGAVNSLPMAAPAALTVWLCLLGRLLSAATRRDTFRLADLGGMPPYGVSVTAVGACKQKGRMKGFYHIANRSDPAEMSGTVLMPLLLSACTVLSGVVCIGGGRMEEFLRVWSIFLSAAVPMGLPLWGTLSVYCLNRRLCRSGCAVAGYAGARAVCDSRRMVLTDNDVFPPGTVSLNGLKTYGEEIGKVVAYAATAARAAGSQLQPIFDQLLSGEGGTYCTYEDLRFYEEGGVGITIRGESVTMGSEYFMKKHHVRLPQELKVKTGVFLAVDGQLIAIFAIKYQPSRNVEWALRALRRNRIEPVLAVRSGNITPGLLKRKFGVNVKPVYPDVSTRLALSALSGEDAPQANALIYREGLMPFAETVIGSRRCCRMVRRSAVLGWVGSLCGLLLAYYLTSAAAYGALRAGYVLVFALLWLLTAVLLGDLTRHY